jgi:hypothetical protein
LYQVTRMTAHVHHPTLTRNYCSGYLTLFNFIFL